MKVYKPNPCLARALATGVALAFVALTVSSPAQTFGITLGPRATPILGVDEGELLLGELNCVACHQAESATQARLGSRQSPRLGESGLRITPQYLRAFLSNPNAEKPGTTMPDLLHSMAASERAETVDALVHFLSSLDKTNRLAAVGADPGKIEQGRLLYHQAGCVACHAPQATAASLNPKTESPTTAIQDAASALGELQAASVPLGNMAKKTSVEQMARFLMDPLKARPSGRMPSLNLTSQEATSLAMFLLRDQANQVSARTVQRVKGLAYSYFEGSFGDTAGLDAQKPRETGLAEKFTLKPRKRNENIGFRFTGFLNVPTDGSYTFSCASDDGTRLYIGGKLVVENDGVHGTTEQSGTIALRAGDHPIALAYFNAGGELTLKVSYEGPGMSKREIPAAAFSTQEAQAMMPLEDEPFTLSLEKADRGKQLFTSIGCAACHQTGPGAAGPTIAAKPLNALRATAGCLSETVAAGSPKYALSPAQRAALQRALSAPEKLAQPLDAKDQVARALVAMNCLACHSRDGMGGPGPGRLEFFRVVGDADLGDEGRIPPHLTRVGGKLRPEWLKQVLLNKGKARPYMATRMPQFGEANVGHLVAAFAQADSRPPAAQAAADSNRDVGFGRKLVGTGGLACISCHTFGSHKSLGIPAMDLTLMTQRLQRDWFHRYVVDPAALRPGTRMPSFWPEGKSPRADILNGDTDRQISAIWAYLARVGEAGLPQGLIQGKIELVATNEAVIYRHFIADAGSRAIGVGYPEKASLAFDANNLRLALIWQGPFIDASRHRSGRGDGFEGPLGYNVVKMPAGSSFAILPSAGSQWPVEMGKKAGFQMHGYRLDDQRRPTFLYSFQAVQIEDYPVAIEGELDASLRRTLTLKSAQPVSNLFFRAWAGANIEAREDGSFLVDGRIKFNFRLAGGAKPVIRASGNQSELLVPVVFNGPEAKIIEEVNW